MFNKNLSSSPSVLIVDDEITTRATLKARLSKVDGFHVLEAQNGQDGIKEAKGKLPNLIILDWKMPDISGIDVLRELRAHKNTKAIPVFMLTSKNLVSDVEIAFEMGAVEYFSKPLDLNLISEKIAKYIGSFDKTA